MKASNAGRLIDMNPNQDPNELYMAKTWQCAFQGCSADPVKEIQVAFPGSDPVQVVALSSCSDRIHELAIYNFLKLRIDMAIAEKEWIEKGYVHDDHFDSPNIKTLPTELIRKFIESVGK